MIEQEPPRYIPIPDPIYVPLAKAALWITSGVLVAVVMWSVVGVIALRVQLDGQGAAVFSAVSTPMVVNIIAAAQVLSIITLSILGYKGSKRQ